MAEIVGRGYLFKIIKRYFNIYGQKKFLESFGYHQNIKIYAVTPKKKIIYVGHRDLSDSVGRCRLLDIIHFDICFIFRSAVNSSPEKDFRWVSCHSRAFLTRDELDPSQWPTADCLNIWQAIK